MKLYLSKTHSDEDGTYEEGKLASIHCRREDIKRLKKFIDDVDKYLDSNDFCHMHFRDNFKAWNKDEFIDIEIDVDER